MPPPLFLDPTTLDYSRLRAGPEVIRAAIPQRYEFEMLDAVVETDTPGVFCGYHDVKPDAWWVRGHIPGRPLFPGILMIEAAAQLSAYIRSAEFGDPGFIGFAAVDGVKFRGQVTPPARFVLIGVPRENRPRRVVCDVQGFVRSTMVFEGTIVGMPV